MEAALNLYRASRDELLALVLHQREQIADLEREQARLRADLAAQQEALAAPAPPDAKWRRTWNPTPSTSATTHSPSECRNEATPVDTQLETGHLAV